MTSVSVVAGIANHLLCGIGECEFVGANPKEAIEPRLDLSFYRVRTTVAHVVVLRAGVDDIDDVRAGYENAYITDVARVDGPEIAPDRSRPLGISLSWPLNRTALRSWVDRRKPCDQCSVGESEATHG